jgi:GntR family transcriptional regulator of arabinose operon
MDIPQDIPLYAFIKRELKNRIESGELPEGARVPSELELARTYNVSRNPTRQALRDLELEGYIVRSPGRGSFVEPRHKRQRVLQVQGWRTLALACPELECPYTRNVVQGFMQRASERGFITMVYFFRFNTASEYDFLTDMRNSGIEGIAYWVQHPDERVRALLDSFRKAGFPFVLIDRYIRDLAADFVVTDNVLVGSRLTAALIQRGHRNIGFVSTPPDNTSIEDRLTGYREALNEHGMACSEDLVGLFDAGAPAGTVVNRIMAHRRRPTAFVCANDGVALKLMDALSELGFAVPEDVELATLDDNRFAEAVELPLVTASQAGEEMGRTSADLLIDRVDQPGQPPRRRFLPATLHLPETEPRGNGKAGRDAARRPLEHPGGAGTADVHR